MITIHADVEYHGPLFDGRTEAAISRGITDGIEAIAKEGRGDLGVQFLRVFKEPTGNYESHLRAAVESPTTAVITDQGIDPYNHWLEGTGSRNYPVTRFKGYRSFEIVGERLERKAERIMRRHLDAALRAVGE